MSKRSVIDMFSKESRTARKLREKAMKTLYWTKREVSGEEAQLSQIAGVLSRFSANQQTAFETGAALSGSPGSTTLMERQVQRALAQVMGRSTSSPETFVSALNDAFPIENKGFITTLPARSMVSLYERPSGMASPDSAGGYLAIEQANLYRQASVIATDTLKVLQGIQPFAPEADLDCVEALRSLISTQIKCLVEEFGRIDGPRQERVETYFEALLGAKPYTNGTRKLVLPDTKSFMGGYLAQFSRSAGLDQSWLPTTLVDESQIAGFELLKNYVHMLKDTWQRYNAPTSEDRPTQFSERLSRASVILSVIVESNRNLMAAMDSVGFSENERRCHASRFTILEDRDTDNVIPFPDMTVNDLSEWVDRFAALEAPPILAESGQYGLDFVTCQADKLFWTIVPVAGFVKTTDPSNSLNKPFLAQVLLQERVSWALDDLLNQLNSLADLAS